MWRVSGGKRNRWILGDKKESNIKEERRLDLGMKGYWGVDHEKLHESTFRIYDEAETSARKRRG
jgi:hypothetical protein